MAWYRSDYSPRTRPDQATLIREESEQLRGRPAEPGTTPDGGRWCSTPGTGRTARCWPTSGPTRASTCWTSARRQRRELERLLPPPDPDLLEEAGSVRVLPLAAGRGRWLGPAGLPGGAPRPEPQPHHPGGAGPPALARASGWSALSAGHSAAATHRHRGSLRRAAPGRLRRRRAHQPEPAPGHACSTSGSTRRCWPPAGWPRSTPTSRSRIVAEGITEANADDVRGRPRRPGGGVRRDRHEAAAPRGGAAAPGAGGHGDERPGPARRRALRPRARPPGLPRPARRRHGRLPGRRCSIPGEDPLRARHRRAGPGLGPGGGVARRDRPDALHLAAARRRRHPRRRHRRRRRAAPGPGRAAALGPRPGGPRRASMGTVETPARRRPPRPAGAAARIARRPAPDDPLRGRRPRRHPGPLGRQRPAVAVRAVAATALSIELDRRRTSAPWTSARRGSYVAIGAALFNARVAAAAMGRLGPVALLPRRADAPTSSPPSTLGRDGDPELAALYPDVLRPGSPTAAVARPSRSTRRSPGRLAAAAAAEGAACTWSPTEDRLGQPAPRSCGASERIRFLTERLHREMIGELRWPGDDLATGHRRPHPGARARSEQAALRVVRRSDVMELLERVGRRHGPRGQRPGGGPLQLGPRRGDRPERQPAGLRARRRGRRAGAGRAPSRRAWACSPCLPPSSSPSRTPTSPTLGGRPVGGRAAAARRPLPVRGGAGARPTRWPSCSASATSGRPACAASACPSTRCWRWRSGRPARPDHRAGPARAAYRQGVAGYDRGGVRGRALPCPRPPTRCPTSPQPSKSTSSRLLCRRSGKALEQTASVGLRGGRRGRAHGPPPARATWPSSVATLARTSLEHDGPWGPVEADGRPRRRASGSSRSTPGRPRPTGAPPARPGRRARRGPRTRASGRAGLDATAIETIRAGARRRASARGRTSPT